MADTIYVVKAGDSLSAIARANNTTVAQLVTWNSISDPNLINVGQSLIVKKDDVVAMPTVKLSATGPGGTVTNNKIVQAALRAEYGTVVVDGIWGPQTTSYYSRWQKSMGFTGSDADGLPGKTSLTALGVKYKFTVDSSSPAPSSGGEPAHNYSRVTWSGKRINVRTRDMLREAERLSGQSIYVTQGSYNAGGVAASAGTHDGGGVVDISSSSASLCQALRKAGFAAWIRTPAQGFSYHIHACAIGDREMSQGAKNQVQSYFNGRNGLAGNGSDTNPPRPWPAWANKYNY